MRKAWIQILSLSLVLVGGQAAWAQAIVPPPGVTPPAEPVKPVEPTKTVSIEFTSLKLMHQKGIISDAEYDSALRDLGETLGAKGGESLTVMLSKWSATLYGFVEADFIHDSTQVLNEVAGNTLIPKDGAYKSIHDRFTVGIRNSRFGIRLRAPEWHGIRASANFEMDALGNQPTPPVTEAQTFTNAAIRIRHYNLKVETPIVDLLIGQYWSLFGWQTYYFPNTVEIMGVPGELFHRDTQFRVSKTIKTTPVNLEIAAALFRPAQRDSGLPEGQFGLRMVLNKWTAMQTVNSTGTAIAPLSIGVSALVRGFRLPEFTSSTPVRSNSATGWGINAGGFIPILPATPKKRGNSLALTGEYAYSEGASDQYVGLTGGVGFPAVAPLLPGQMGMPGAYVPNIDPGIVTYTAADLTLHLVHWQSFNVGAQYYFPGLDGKLWVAAAYSRINSDNAKLLVAQTPAGQGAVEDREEWADGNLFWDATPAIRVGLEYAWFKTTYADGGSGTNHRIQGAVWYLF